MAGSHGDVPVRLERHTRTGSPAWAYGVVGKGAWNYTLVRAELEAAFPEYLHVAPMLDIASIVANTNDPADYEEMETGNQKIDRLFVVEAEDVLAALPVVEQEMFQETFLELNEELQGVRIHRGGLQVALGSVGPISADELRESLDFIADAAKRLSACAEAVNPGRADGTPA